MFNTVITGVWFRKFLNHKKKKHNIKPMKLAFGELVKDLEEF